MNENNNTTLIQTMYAAFAKGDIQTILDRLAPDVEWTLEGPATIPYAGKKTGPGEVLKFFDALASAEENPQLTIEAYIAQGDQVATFGRYSGTVKATRKRFDCAIAHIFTLRNGKVTRFLDFIDTAHLADAHSSGVRSGSTTA